MRVLLLLRGSPGCGKSTWIENNGLKPYALSADDIRMMCSSPQLSINGKYTINQSNDSTVWSLLFQLLEIRMQNGEFTVIDATNSKTSEMNRYKELCTAYKYRIYCVDFTDIPIQIAKQRNVQRAEVKRVPEEVIDKMYSRFQTQKIPSGITVIKPDQLESIWMKKFNLSEYGKIHIVGDVHGCNTALQDYIGEGVKDDEFYIFAGDYIDRGLENSEVVKFLLSIYNKKNVLLLEGSHEKWLWVWANNGVCQSKEFELVTKTQLENDEIDKKEVRKMFRRMGQCAYFEYYGKTYLVTHGGLSTLPENLTMIATSQMIKGVGTYNDCEQVDNEFLEKTPEDCYQIHGHRNVKHLPPQVNDRCFNLEGKVEFGGCLRCLTLLSDGSQSVSEIKNNIFKQPEKVIRNTTSKVKTVADVILSLRQNKYIQEKKYGNISSFNFTKSAFFDRIWDEQTTKARGFYINVPKQKIVARAYEKFFNINERPETKFDVLENKLSFPVTAYVKENGFLGLVSYNEEDDSLFITTKSSPDGCFAEWLKENFYNIFTEDTISAIKQYTKDNNVTFVFECVDMKNDPHIIDYDKNELFLLDIVYNELDFRKLSYEEMCAFADKYGIKHKEKASIIETWQEFFDWYYEVTNEDYLYNGKHIEGFVIEDSAGYMTKLKLSYYNFWKFMRSISHEAIRKGYVDKRRLSSLVTPLANQYYAWVRELHDIEPADLVPKDICSLRRLFFNSEVGKAFLGESQ